MEPRNKTVKRGRGRPQARPDEVTRRLIHEAAQQEFLESGYAATCMEAVAARAGVSTKTLYRLIPTKAALFEGMVTARLDEFFAGIVADVVDSPDLASALETMLVDCAGLTLDKEVLGVHRLVIAESDRFPELAQAFYKNGIQRVPVVAGGVAGHPAQARDAPAGGSEGRRRHAPGDDDLRTPARRDTAAGQAAFAERRPRAGSRLRPAVPQGMRPVSEGRTARSPISTPAPSEGSSIRRSKAFAGGPAGSRAGPGRRHRASNSCA